MDPYKYEAKISVLFDRTTVELGSVEHLSETAEPTLSNKNSSTGQKFDVVRRVFDGFKVRPNNLIVRSNNVRRKFGRTSVRSNTCRTVSIFCSVELYKVRPNFLYFTSCRSFLGSTEHLFGRTLYILLPVEHF